MKVTELQKASQEFLAEIKSQLPEEYQVAFDLILHKLEELSKEVQARLNKLNALEAGGVDNWEWYEQSLEDAGLLDEDEESEND